MDNQRAPMDLDELRRRHEAYRQRQERLSPRRPVAPQPARPAVDPVKTAPIEEQPVEPVAAPAEEEKPVEPMVEEAPVEPEMQEVEPEAESETEPDEPLDDEPEVESEPASDEPEADDWSDEDDEEYEETPNAFASVAPVFKRLIGKVFHRNHEEEYEPEDEDVSEEVPAEDEDEVPEKKKGLFSFLKRGHKDDLPDYDDSDYAEDDYEAEDFPESAPVPDVGDAPIPEEPVEAPEDEIETREEPAPEAPADAPFDAEDVPEDEHQPSYRKDSYSFESVVNPFDDDAEDEDTPPEDEEDEDEDGEARESALSKFRKLFFVRLDELDPSDLKPQDKSDDPDEWTPEDDDEWEPTEDSDSVEDSEPAAKETPFEAEPYEDEPFELPEDEGGTDMDEMNKLNIEMTEQMASGLESNGMSRRARRELAEKRAAEEAAKKAAEMAYKYSNDVAELDQYL